MAGSIKDARDNLVNKESGKRLYVSPLDYQEQIRKPTIKGMDTGTEPWSEFEKPYLEDSYEEMEYFMWNWPGFSNFNYDFDFDNPAFLTSEQGSLPGGGLLVYTCQLYGGFCPGETRSIKVFCSHTAIAAQLSNPTLHGADFSVSLVSPTELSVTAVEDCGGAVEVDILMRSAGGQTAWHESILIAEDPDCVTCETAETFEADDDNNPTTVTDGIYYALYVLGGKPPFVWTLDAGGSDDVELRFSATNGRENVLEVTDGCGGLLVTVTDDCDDEVTIPLQSADGTWFGCGGASGAGDGAPCSCGSGYVMSSSGWGDAGVYYIFGAGYGDIARYWRFYEDGPESTYACHEGDAISCCCENSDPCSTTRPCFPNNWASSARCAAVGKECIHWPCLNLCSGCDCKFSEQNVSINWFGCPADEWNQC